MKKLFNRLNYAFKTVVLRKKLPYLVGMVINDTCNLDCFYCESKNSGIYNFNFKQAIDALSDAYARGHRSLYFTGGEPMIWEDNGHKLEELIRFARKLGFFDVFIFTNGTMPLDIADCNYIVTVDGPREVHNKIRNNTYDLVIENVRNLVTKSVFASMTFCKQNFFHLETFVKEVTELGLFKGISFNFLTHWPQVVEKNGLSAEQRLETLDKIWSLKQKGFPVVLSKAAYLALRSNNWKRPIPQIELMTNNRVFKCCRDVDNPEICENCGYINCVEVSQILDLKPSAVWQVLKMVN